MNQDIEFDDEEDEDVFEEEGPHEEILKKDFMIEFIDLDTNKKKYAKMTGQCCKYHSVMAFAQQRYDIMKGNVIIRNSHTIH